MSASNLPPGVTPAMIDAEMGDDVACAVCGREPENEDEAEEYESVSRYGLLCPRCVAAYEDHGPGRRHDDE